MDDRALKIKQLQAELSNLKKLNASKIEIMRRTIGEQRTLNEVKAKELEVTCKTLKDQVKNLKTENIEIERQILHKQSAFAEAEKKLMNMRASQLENQKLIEGEIAQLEKLQVEYDGLYTKKKELLDVKNAKEEEHKILKDNLKVYLKELQQKFIGYLHNGSMS